MLKIRCGVVNIYVYLGMRRSCWALITAKPLFVREHDFAVELK
jgi:hypothetical protein